MSFQFTAGRFKAFTASGALASGYKLYSYVSGTTTPKATYTSATLASANTNPITLDAAGEASVWLGSGAYTFVLKDAAGVTQWTVDGVVDPTYTVESLLSDTSGGSTGAGAIAFDAGDSYTAGSVGAALAVIYGSGGSDSVGFIQSGADAIAGTVQDELRRTVNVKQYGAVCDLTTDDYSAIQNAIDHAATIGADVEIPWPGCLISQPLVIKVQANLGGSYTQEQLHFTPYPTVNLVGKGRPKLKASASMGAMVTYTYNSTYSNLAPFWSEVRGILFDGGGYASVGVKTDYAMHVSVKDCAIFNLNSGTGISLAPGYGVHRIENCSIWATTCIKVDHAGDTHIEACDFWPKSLGVDVAIYGGDMHIERCVFNRDTETGTLTGVRLSGDYASAADDHVRHVRIISNEFAGMDIGVYGTKGSSYKNVFGLTIAKNHTKANGVPTANTKMVLVELHGATDSIIEGNHLNNLGQGSGYYAVSTDVPIKLYQCDRIKITGNNFAGTRGTSIYDKDGTALSIIGNTFADCGQAGTSEVVIDLDATVDAIVTANNAVQSSASYAQTFVQERTGANRNYIHDNPLKGVALSSAYGRIGAGSVIEGAKLRGAAAWTPGSVSTGTTVTTTVTVTGARVGDLVSATFSNGTSGCDLSGYVSATNTVTARLTNNTGSTVVFGAGTVAATVTPTY